MFTLYHKIDMFQVNVGINTSPVLWDIIYDIFIRSSLRSFWFTTYFSYLKQDQLEDQDQVLLRLKRALFGMVSWRTFSPQTQRLLLLSDLQRRTTGDKKVMAAKHHLDMSGWFLPQANLNEKSRHGLDHLRPLETPPQRWRLLFFAVSVIVSRGISPRPPKQNELI